MVIGHDVLLDGVQSQFVFVTNVVKMVRIGFSHGFICNEAQNCNSTVTIAFIHQKR